MELQLHALLTLTLISDEQISGFGSYIIEERSHLAKLHWVDSRAGAEVMVTLDIQAMLTIMTLIIKIINDSK
jgi:hypothetical protein